MIRFLPDFGTETNQLRKQELMQLCEGFSGKNKNIACEQHSNYENIVQVGIGASIGFKVVDTCCSHFHQKLVREFSDGHYGEKTI